MNDMSHTRTNNHHSMGSTIRNPYRNAYKSSATTNTNTTIPVRPAAPSETMLNSLDSRPCLSEMQALRERLVNKRASPELALEFAGMVAHCLAPNNNDNNNDDTNDYASTQVAALELLAKAMDDWQDQVLYAVLMQESNQEHLLERLTRLSADNSQNEQIRQNATICLAKAWLCLERLQETTVLNDGNSLCGREFVRDLPWWMPEKRMADSLGIQSLQSLDQIHGNNPQPPCSDPTKAALLTILATLLKYQLLKVSSSPTASAISACSSTGCCTIPKDKLSQLTSKLIKEIQVLNHSVLSPSSSEYTLPIAMLSMAVLSFLQESLANDSLFSSLNQTIQSTGLVENLVRFVFVSAEGGAPRWTATGASSHRLAYFRSMGRHLFSCWRVCDNEAWKILVANLKAKLDAWMDSFWSTLVKDPTKSNLDEEQLSMMLWLFLYMRSHARCKLSLVLERRMADGDSNHASSKEVALQNILHSLFGLLRNSSGGSYSSKLMIARLLCILLSDGRSVSSNDELSRNLWNAMDESIVEGHCQTVLEHACTNDVNQPLLLALVDIMEILLEQSNIYSCNGLVETLGAHNLESLIYLVKPKDIRYDFLLGTQDEDTETPPHHNLSRMDETSICIEHEETKPPRGLDHSIRLSVATSLAHLAYGSSIVSAAAPPKDESTRLFLSRISTVVNDFFVEYHATIERAANAQEDGTAEAMPSMDQIKRFTRFWHCMGTPENENFLSTTLFSSISLRRQTLSRHFEAHSKTQQQLKTALQREKMAQEETKRLQQQLQTQSILFRQEMSRAKANLAQDARQVVSMHALERSRAEERSTQLQKETEEATLELETIRTELQTAREELQTTACAIEELHGTIGSLQQQVQDEKARAEEISNQAEAHQETIQSYEEKCDDMQTTIEEKDDAFSRVQDTNQTLQDNLEDLFADMCSLAQMYQHNESQEASQKLQNTEAMQAMEEKLVRERKSNKELNEKIAEVEEENEKLYRKLGKYKDRLEQERKGRREDQKKEEEHRRKRNGPVSYLNSLHTSTLENDRSRSTRSSSRDAKPPSQYKRSAHEKENSSSGSYHHRSNTSQRRTKY